MDTAGASYPVTIDPWVQQAQLTASDGAASDEFGYSVAIDGDTAIVGADRDDGSHSNQGSAYVFVRRGTTWSQQVVSHPVRPIDGRSGVASSLTQRSVVLTRPDGAAVPTDSALPLRPSGRVAVGLGGDGNFPIASCPATYEGYLLAGDRLAALPIGSTLDPVTGVFVWHPGIGFHGDYYFVFVATDCMGTLKPARVTVLVQ